MFFNFGCFNRNCGCEHKRNNWNWEQNWNNCNPCRQNFCCNDGFDREIRNEHNNWRGNCQCFPIPFIICCDDDNNNCCR